jgi:hypothetical protein
MVECDGLNSSENGQTRGRWRNKNRNILEATIEFTQASQTLSGSAGFTKAAHHALALLLLASSKLQMGIVL